MNYEKVLATAKEQLEAAREKARSEQFDGPVMATLVQWRTLRARVAKLETALEAIADEENVYKGYGDYDTAPRLTAEEAQSLARDALKDAPQ